MRDAVDRGELPPGTDPFPCAEVVGAALAEERPAEVAAFLTELAVRPVTSAG